MKNKFLLAAVVAAPLLAVAATDEQIESAADVLDQTIQNEQQRREATRPAEVPPSSELPSELELDLSNIPAGENCIELERLAIDGARVMDEWDLEVLEAPLVGKCISPELASTALAKATNYYLQRGFVTTRAYLPNQDLSDGVLTVYIAEGRVQQVVAKSSPELNVTPVYTPDEDLPLNIRDLEQAVDQMNAIPGNDVTMQIEPGDVPGESNVVFENRGEPKPVHTLSIDNSGSESVGLDAMSLRVVTGDVLNNHVVSLYYRKTKDTDDKHSYSGNLNVAMPWGYNTFSLGHTRGGFETILTFPVTGTQLDNEGANQSTYAEWNRVFFRDQTSKHSINLKAKRDSVESYLDGQLIGVNSRTLDAVEISTNSVWGFGKKVLTLKPEFAIGISEVDNLPAGVNTPVENPQSEYLRFKLTADWQHPFTLGSQSLLWGSKFVGQMATVPLYGSQQLNVGGAASVRGSTDVTISGDEGNYWQNTLTLKKQVPMNGVVVNQDYYIGYDTGRVRSIREGQYEGDMEAGVVGTNWKFGAWKLDIKHSIPVRVDRQDKGDKFTTTALSVDF